MYYIQLEEELRKQLLDVENETRECKQREADLLLYTEKLTENNAHWKSQACDLQSRVSLIISGFSRFFWSFWFTPNTCSFQPYCNV